MFVFSITRVHCYHCTRYGEHQCSYIFQPKKLDLGRLATGFGLLHLPSMPEIRGKKLVGFTPDPIGYDAIPYANKAKEKHRQEALAKVKTKPSDEGEEEDGDLDGASGDKGSKRPHRAKLTEAWSKKKEQREKRDKKKTRKALSKAAATAAAAAAAVAEANADADDWDEDDLEAEARAFKKFKRGKMTKEEYLKFNLDIDDGL